VQRQTWSLSWPDIGNQCGNFFLFWFFAKLVKKTPYFLSFESLFVFSCFIVVALFNDAVPTQTLPAIYDALAQSDMNAGRKGLSDTSDNGM
jgi:hypothetical protein